MNLPQEVLIPRVAEKTPFAEASDRVRQMYVQDSVIVWGETPGLGLEIWLGGRTTARPCSTD